KELSGEIAQKEADINSLCDLVDNFYKLFQGRNWIYTGNLSVKEIRGLIAGGLSAEVAEQRLIEIISERIREKFWMLGLFEHEGLRVRRHLLERARQHYIDERWDCCALMLITIMDGFVNDIDPSSRRGLHTREPEEMSAWDSLAGHH